MASDLICALGALLLVIAIGFLVWTFWRTTTSACRECVASPRWVLEIEVPFDRTARYLPEFDPSVIYPLRSFVVSLSGPYAAIENNGWAMPYLTAEALMVGEIVAPLRQRLLVHQTNVVPASILSSNPGFEVLAVTYPPTIEVLAKRIFDALSPLARAYGVTLDSVTVSTTDGQSARYLS